jgi:cardiolipin synthase
MYISLSLKTIKMANTIPTWLSIFVVSKDLIIIIGIGTIFLLKDDIIISITLWGKSATVLEDFTVFFVLFFNYLGKTCVFLTYLYTITLIFVLISTYSYVKIGFRIINNDRG